MDRSDTKELKKPVSIPVSVPPVRLMPLTITSGSSAYDWRIVLGSAMFQKPTCALKTSKPAHGPLIGMLVPLPSARQASGTSKSADASQPSWGKIPPYWGSQLPV